VTIALGDRGEEIVARYLEKRGYRILARNYRSRVGEIDIVAEKDEFIAFVEVKTRNFEYFSVASCVTRGKQRKIIKTAKHYFAAKRVDDKVGRFDVATVLFCGDGAYDVEYLENAFSDWL